MQCATNITYYNTQSSCLIAKLANNGSQVKGGGKNTQTIMQCRIILVLVSNFVRSLFIRECPTAMMKHLGCKKLIVRPFSIQPRLRSAWGVSDASAGPRLWLGGGGGLGCCPASVGVPRAGTDPHPHP